MENDNSNNRPSKWPRQTGWNDGRGRSNSGRGNHNHSRGSGRQGATSWAGTHQQQERRHDQSRYSNNDPRERAATAINRSDATYQNHQREPIRQDGIETRLNNAIPRRQMHHQPQSQSSSGNNQFHGSRPFQPSPFTPLVLNSTTNTAAATMNHTVAPVPIIQQPLTGEQWKALPWIDRLKSQIPQTNPELFECIPDEYKLNPDENAIPALLVDEPLMPRKIVAAEATFSNMKNEFDKNAKTPASHDNDSDYDSTADSDDSSHHMMPDGAGPPSEPQWGGVTKSQLSTFIEALPHFLLFNIDFHLTLPKRLCHCPLSKVAYNWREQFGISHEIGMCHENKKFEPYPLLSHLSSGAHSGSDNVLAIAACRYLKELYEDYYKGEHRSFDHEGLSQGGKYRDEVIAFKEKRKKRYLKEAQDAAEAERIRALQAESEVLVLREKTGVLLKENKRLKEIGKRLGLTGEIGQLEINPKMMQEYKIMWMNIFFHLKGILLMTEENSNKLGKPILSFFLKYEHKRIVLNISQDFNLQKCFQAKSFTRVFFADLVSFSQNPSFLMPLNVKYKVDKDSKKALRWTDDIKAVDEGGPSRVFYEQVWTQLGTLSVSFVIVDDTVKRVMLFEPSAAGFVPMTDEMLCHTVASGLGIENLGEYEFADLKCIVESDEKGNKVLEEARLIYRAIGRIMANCLATGNVISPTALPKLFRNALLRNIMPSNILYSELELPHHLLELNLNQQTMDHLTETYEGVESDPVQKFKCAVEKYFLDSRSIALESLREGLTLNGLINFDVTRNMPLEAVNRLTIGRLKVDPEEVISSFKIDDEFEGSLTDNQEFLFKEIIPQVIREKHKDDENFLTDFLQWCTGQKYMPYRDLEPHYTIDFNFFNGSNDDEDEYRSDSTFLPTVKTCANYIVLPVGAYNADKELFQERLETAIRLCKDHFDAS